MIYLNPLKFFRFVGRARHFRPLLAALALVIVIGAEAEIVVVVATDSSVTRLNKSQISNIFLGKTSRFPDGSRAVPLNQPESSADRSEFNHRYMEKSAAQIKAHWSKMIFTGRGQPPREVDSSDLKQLLAERAGAIAYIDATMVDHSMKVLEIE